MEKDKKTTTVDVKYIFEGHFPNVHADNNQDAIKIVDQLFALLLGPDIKSIIEEGKVDALHPFTMRREYNP